MMKADGSGLTNLSVKAGFHAGGGVLPVFSPGGSKVAFFSGAPYPGGLYVVNSDASGLTLLTNGVTPWRSSAPPAWSPDGSKIAFSSSGGRDVSGTSAIYVIGADGSGLTPLTDLTDGQHYDLCPAWSPDGQHIAFLRAHRARGFLEIGIERMDIETIKVDGSGQARVVKDVSSCPQWAPVP